jgi:alkylation response protein AidB-like acyl-CoA dehydrogenase
MQDYKTEHPFDLTLSEEQQMTWDMLRKFAETELRPQARQAESDGRPSSQLLDKIKSLDLISLIIPEAYGGIGLKQDAVSNALTLEALSYGDSVIGYVGLYSYGDCSNYCRAWKRGTES